MYSPTPGGLSPCLAQSGREKGGRGAHRCSEGDWHHRGSGPHTSPEARVHQPRDQAGSRHPGVPNKHLLNKHTNEPTKELIPGSRGVLPSALSPWRPAFPDASILSAAGESSPGCPGDPPPKKRAISHPLQECQGKRTSSSIRPPFPTSRWQTPFPGAA